MFRSADLLSSKTLQTMFKTPMVIAIDGPTASGKGTLAARLAKRLDFGYMDTGALYRGVAKTAFDENLDPSKKQDAIKAAKILLEKYTPAIQDDPAIRSEAVSRGASEVAAVPEVRAILHDIQVKFAKEGSGVKHKARLNGVVLDGRDIGTVICPDAHIKFFIDAKAEVRAERRASQLEQKGQKVDRAQIMKDLQIRDGRDTSRNVAPTLPAEDAFIIDTSSLDSNEVLARALDIVRGYLVGARAAAKQKLMHKS